MARISHEDPTPRDRALDCLPWQPHLNGSTTLQVPCSDPQLSFREVLDSRSSCRDLLPIPTKLLGALLWHSARTRETRSGDAWQRRAAPSAGGIHPIQLLAVEPGRDEVLLYDPLRHAMSPLADVETVEVAAVRAVFHEVLPEAKGTFLVLAADHERTRAGYTNPESLVWRDAGCVLATLQLVACWLGIGSCPLGILGGKLVSLVAPGGELTAAGVLAVGERPRPN